MADVEAKDKDASTIDNEPISSPEIAESASSLPPKDEEQDSVLSGQGASEGDI